MQTRLVLLEFYTFGGAFMKLADLFDGIEISHTNAYLDCEICDIPVTYDSEQVRPGGMFICIKGLHTDGHDYILRAVYHGAAFIVIEDGFAGEDTDSGIRQFFDASTKIKYISVKNTRDAAARIFDNYYNKPSRRVKVIAVTGTNGKTTTTYMLRAIFEEAGFKTGLIGTISGSMTTPDPDVLYRQLDEFAKDGCEYVVMETSSHALALHKLSPLVFEAGIFTNLTPEHLDFHGTMDAYYEAKAKLFENCRMGFFNYDDNWGQKMYFSAPCEKYYYSAQSDNADFTAKNIADRGIDGIEYHLLTKNTLFRVSSPIPGRFTVYNSLCAASCAYKLGIDQMYIRDALRKMTGVPGRLQRVLTQNPEYAVFIDYAHTPDALENVLHAIRSFMRPDQHLTVLFGCGGDRDRLKRPVMGAIASRLADFVIVTSDNSRSEVPEQIIRDILRGIDKEKPHKVIVSRREAIAYAVQNAHKNDVILLAGKGHENYEITDKGKFPFCEADIVLESERG